MDALIEDLLPKYENFWNQSHPDDLIIRLGILREMIQVVHAEKSRCMATPGLKDRGIQAKIWEEKLRAYCGSEKLVQPLREQLQTLPQQTFRDVPKEIIDPLGTDRLERPDRKWEKQICAIAAQERWHLFALDAWIGLKEAENFYRRFIEKIRGEGLILYTEAGPLPPGSPAMLDSTWFARWVIVVKPHFKPIEYNSKTEFWKDLPGIATIPSPPHWTLLF